MKNWRFNPLSWVVFILALAAFLPVLAQTTDLVDNTNDSGVDSFRQAILDENGGSIDVAFIAIGGLGSIQVNQPTSNLPAITQDNENYVNIYNGKMIIDGSQVSGGSTILLNVQALDTNLQGIYFTNLSTSTAAILVNGTLNMTDGDVTNCDTSLGAVSLTSGSDLNLHITTNYFSQTVTEGFAGNNGGDIAMGTGAVVTVNLDSGVTYGFYDGIGGAGSLIKQGAGLLNLPAPDSYSGGTLLSAGTIVADESDSLGTGTVTIDGGQLVLDGNAVTNTFVWNSGTVQVGDFNNHSSVAQGNFTVPATGTLTGIGTVQGAVTNNGVVDPGIVLTTGGPHVGALTVDSFSQGAAGTLNIDVSPFNTTYLESTGSLQLNGALVLGGPGPNAGLVRLQTDFLTASGGVTGTFSTVTNDLTGYNDLLNYGADTVTLTLSMQSPLEDATQAAAITPNEMAALNALTGALPTAGTAMVNQIQLMYNARTAPSGPTAQQAAVDKILDQAYGPVYASDPQWMVFTQNSGQLSALQTVERQWGQAVTATADKSGFWLENNESFGSIAGNANLEGFNQSDTSFTAGYDLPLGGGLTGGVKAGTVASKNTSADNQSDTTINGWQAGVYGNQKTGDFDFSAEGTFGINHYTTSRTVPIGSEINQAQGTFDGSEIGLSAQAGLPLTAAGIKLEPFLGAQWSHVGMDGFTETGAGSLDLDVQSQTYDALGPYLGLSLRQDDGLGGGWTLSPFAVLTASRDLINQTPGYQATFTGAPNNPFTITGNSTDPLLVGAAGGIQLGAPGQFNLFAEYNGFFNGSEYLNTINGGFSLAL